MAKLSTIARIARWLDFDGRTVEHMLRRATITVDDFAQREAIPLASRVYGMGVYVPKVYQLAGVWRGVTFRWTKDVAHPNQANPAAPFVFDDWVAEPTSDDDRNRGNHTGTQNKATINGLPETIDSFEFRITNNNELTNDRINVLNTDYQVHKAAANLDLAALRQVRISDFQAVTVTSDTPPAVELSVVIDGAPLSRQKVSYGGVTIAVSPLTRTFTSKDQGAVKDFFVPGNSLSDATDTPKWHTILATRRGRISRFTARYSRDIAQPYRAGLPGYELYLAFQGNALPAGGIAKAVAAINGNTAIDITAGYAFLNAGDPNLTTGVTMQGVVTDGLNSRHGTAAIPHAASTAYTFTQDAGLPAITFAGPVRFIPDIAKYPAASDNICGTGQNIFYSGVPNVDGDHTNPYDVAIVDAFAAAAQGNRFLFVDVLPDASWPADGTPIVIDGLHTTWQCFSAMQARNTKLEARHPGARMRSLPTPGFPNGRTLLKYLQDRANPNYPGNAADIAAGLTPREFRIQTGPNAWDPLHLNLAGHTAWADFAEEALQAQVIAAPLAIGMTVTWTAIGIDPRTGQELAPVSVTTQIVTGYAAELAEQVKGALTSSAYFPTIAEAVAALDAGSYFNSDDQGAQGPHAGVRWIYEVTDAAPHYAAVRRWARGGDFGYPDDPLALQTPVQTQEALDTLQGDVDTRATSDDLSNTAATLGAMIAERPTTSDLASSTPGKGASLLKLADGRTVQAALVEVESDLAVRATSDDLTETTASLAGMIAQRPTAADLASSAPGKGAAMVKLQDGRTAQAALDSVQSDLAQRPTATSLGASTAAALLGTASGSSIEAELTARTKAADLASSASGKGASMVAVARQAYIGFKRDAAQELLIHIRPEQFGATVKDGSDARVSSWLIGGSRVRGYASLAAIQADYPHVTSLNDQINFALIQAAINYAGSLPFGGNVRLDECGIYLTNPLTLKPRVSMTGGSSPCFNETSSEHVGAKLRLAAGSTAPILANDPDNPGTAYYRQNGEGGEPQYYWESQISNIVFDGNAPANITDARADCLRLERAWSVKISGCYFKANNGGMALRILDCNGTWITENAGIGACFIESYADSVIAHNQWGGQGGGVNPNWTTWWFTGVACWKTLIDTNIVYNNTGNQGAPLFVFTAAGDTFTTPLAHPYQDQSPVTLETTGSLPAGLATDTCYYLKRDTATTFKLATSRKNLKTGTFITVSGGTGVHTVRGGPNAVCYVEGCQNLSFTGNRFDQGYGFNLLFARSVRCSVMGGMAMEAGTGNANASAEGVDRSVSLRNGSNYNTIMGMTIDGTITNASGAHQNYGIHESGCIGNDLLHNRCYGHAVSNFRLNGQNYPGQFLSLGSDRFEAIGGVPAIGAIGGNRRNGWLLDATADETVATELQLPPGWSKIRIVLLWTNAGTGSGDVAWSCNLGRFAVGESLNATDTASSNIVFATAGTQDVLMSTTLTPDMTVLANSLTFLRIKRTGSDPGDTLGNDAALIAVRVEDASCML